MSNGFDITRDMTFPYFCEACLTGIPEENMSPDLRYCQGCYNFLLKEAEMDTRRRGGDWKPVLTIKKPIITRELEGTKAAPVSRDMRKLCPLKNTPQNKVDIIQPLDPQKKASRKGRPRYLELPEDMIHELASRGMGSKSICTHLKPQAIKDDWSMKAHDLQPLNEHPAGSASGCIFTW